MKTVFAKIGLMGVLITVLVVVFAGLALAGVIHPAATALPFLIGAVKVRDEFCHIRTIKYTHTGATVVDTVYYLNGRVLLAMNSAAANVENVFVVCGAIEYTKVSAQAWKGGDRIWWDNGNSRFTNVYGANCYYAGYAAEAAANPTSTGIIVLDAITLVPGMAVDIPDSANGKTYNLSATNGTLEVVES